MGHTGIVKRNCFAFTKKGLVVFRWRRNNLPQRNVSLLYITIIFFQLWVGPSVPWPNLGRLGSSKILLTGPAHAQINQRLFRKIDLSYNKPWIWLNRVWFQWTYRLVRLLLTNDKRNRRMTYETIRYFHVVPRTDDNNKLRYVGTCKTISREVIPTWISPRNGAFRVAF